ncbi:MAG: T9SS type A sorting domain-containing protein [Bacteroidota bacterium]
MELNLVGVNIRTDDDPAHPARWDYAHPDSNWWNTSAVREVCERANAYGLNVLINDAKLGGRFNGERIILHPESSDDFGTHGGYDTDTRTEFSSFSTTLLQRDGGTNCIKMDNNAGTVSGLQLNRIQELSVYRDWTDADSHRVSGMYQVSVTVLCANRVAPLPTNDDLGILHVDIWYTHPVSHTRERIRCTLELGQLLDTDPSAPRQLFAGVQEIVIGEIEIQQAGSNDRVIFVEPGDHTDLLRPWWQLNGPQHVRGTTRMADQPGILANVVGEFDIEISYGASDVQLWLDAVCLTNPATFGLWHPDNPGTLAIHQNHRAAMDERIRFVCKADADEHAAVLPGLRFLMGSEQVYPGGTYWTAFLLDKLLKSESGGQVELFSTYGADTNTELAPVLGMEYLSGPYWYPLLTSQDRPTLSTTTPNEYCESLYDAPMEGFRRMWSLLYRNIQTRASFPGVTPWIPYIQNHSNLLTTNPPPGWWDRIPNREPSASELRFQCNTALAFGAGGVLFYAFSSVPYTPDAPTSPPTVMVEDRILPDPANGVPWTADLDIDMGTMGFLGSEGVEDVRRTLDWNGENKWDSTQAYIHDFLQPVGSLIAKHLKWKNCIQWYLRGQPGDEAGANDLVSMIVSRRQDVAGGIDSQEQTYVMASELTPNIASPPAEGDATSRYLFVLNGNTYDGPVHAGVHPIGQRHITVKLSSFGQTVDEWRVTNVLTKDVWIVRASDTPDETSYANGFTEYFAPGAAALYRLDPMVSETTDFSFSAAGECENYDRSIYIEPAATLRLKDVDKLAFSSGNGIFCDGYLYANKTEFHPCDLEQYWEGILARNGGTVELEQVKIYNGSAIAGSAGSISLDEACKIYFTDCALKNLGGTLTSNSTESYFVSNHLIHVGSSISSLYRDHAYGLSNYGSTGVSVHSNVQRIRVDESIFEGFWRGAYASGGTLLGDSDGNPPADGGNNSFRTLQHGLVADNHGWILLGALSDTTQDKCERNEIILIDPTGYQAETDASSWILARNCWWEPANMSAAPPEPSRYTGNVEFVPLLDADPIPFVGSGGSSITKLHTLSKTSSTASPPNGRGQIIAAAAAHNHGALRHLIGQFLNSSEAATADCGMLGFLHRSLRDANAPRMVDSLLNLCLNRTDMGSKLLAADIVAEDSLFSDAIQILNAYSFVGSADLLKGSLIRKAMFYPRAWDGGYAEGILAIDSLRLLQDSLLIRVIDYYPVLYSRLSEPSVQIPKVYTEKIIERSLPTGIDVWPNYPNPFTDVTSFTFKLSEATHVRLAVFDAMGREVAVVADADYERGVHSAVLRSGSLPNGLYFYRLITNVGVIQRKMMLMR